MRDEHWWEPRRPGEATAEYLGRVLDDLGAAELAAKARLFHYDDYFCPDDVDDGMNINRLVSELRDWSTRSTRLQRDQSRPVIQAAMNGEFDGTREESLRWARSDDGQATFNLLLDPARYRPRE